MAIKFKRFTRRFYFTMNIIVILLFLLACIVPSLHPLNWWFLSFLGITFPFLLLLVILFLLSWLLVKMYRRALLGAVALLLGIKSILSLIAFHPTATFNEVKKPNSIRVLTWNVARFIELKRNNNKGSKTRLQMMELLQQQNADVLCLQEFHTSTNPDFYDNIEKVTSLGFPYHYFVYDQDGDQHFYSSAIFSKFPIIDSGMLRFPRPSAPEVLIHLDLKVRQDTIRVYTTHMQSLQFSSKDYALLNSGKPEDDDIVADSRSVFSKYKRGVIFRSIHAETTRVALDISPRPTIFCADMNDVPNSYTYNTVRGDLQDAFLKKGFGIGRTFSAISPTLRIDYILADDRFKVLQFKRVLKQLSDHYMQVADLELKK